MNQLFVCMNPEYDFNCLQTAYRYKQFAKEHIIFCLQTNKRLIKC